VGPSASRTALRHSRLSGNRGEETEEIDHCGPRIISINDADCFGTPERPKEIVLALKSRSVRW
jgi:hypothetical protein